MKILHLIPNLEKGGAERLVLDICNELQNHPKTEVKLVTFSASNEYKFLSENVDWKVIPSFFLPSISGKSIAQVEELNTFISTFKPDVIHSHLWESEFVLSQISDHNTKWVTHFHSNMKQLSSSFSFQSKKKITAYYEKRFVLKSFKQKKSHFITISNDTRDYANSVLPNQLKQRVHLVKNAINFDLFFNPTKKNFTSNDTIKLISVGSLVKKKNHIFLIHVINHLKLLGTKSELVILGEGVERKKIESLISAMNLNEHVFLKGNVDHVAKHLHQADLYVHSATYEPFGLVLIEAMAAGLPVVSLDGKGNRDIIQDNENGFMLKNSTPEEFGNKINDLINDKKCYNRIQNNAITFAKNYDIKKYVEKLLIIYNQSFHD